MNSSYFLSFLFLSFSFFFFPNNLIIKELVLLIHAGGYSKRLPHVSATGKIFTSLPIGIFLFSFFFLPLLFSLKEKKKIVIIAPMLQMLELKLIMYIHFPQRMSPGVFIFYPFSFTFFFFSLFFSSFF